MTHGLRRPLVVGNWKMNGSCAAARARALALRNGVMSTDCDVLVAPPAVHVFPVSEELRGSRIGVAGQDVSEFPDGAHTGDTSAAMLVDAGCSHVLVGHSERRARHGETDDEVAAKAFAALGAGLVPIVCVGETLAEREGGMTEAVVLRQLEAVLAGSLPGGLDMLVLAYEPVWAIGTGRNATPEQAQAVHSCLRARVARADAGAATRVRILYGGSVKASNAPALFAMPDIDGVLVGGASLDAQEFLEICAAAR